MCFSEPAEIFKCRNQQTDWQGRNNPRTIDHSHLGGPQADHSYVHIHSRHPPVGEWSLDSLCQAKAEGQQFPHRMSSPHPWHQLVDKVPVFPCRPWAPIGSLGTSTVVNLLRAKDLKVALSWDIKMSSSAILKSSGYRYRDVGGHCNKPQQGRNIHSRHRPKEAHCQQHDIT